jgi:hypothetical protein
MKRTILFRGKRVDNNEWAIGYYWVDNTNSKHKITTNLSDDNFTCHEINPETLGQLVGITKSEIKIWEGDIVMNGQSVRFIEYRWSNFVATTADEDQTILLSFIKDIKPIGNIYDNPELLKQ